MVGRVLRDHRVRAGLKVAQAAVLAGMRRETLSRIEAGRTRVATDKLMKLTDLITVPPTEWVRPWVEEETSLRALLFVTRHLIDRGELDSVRLILDRVRTLARLSPNHLRGEVYHQWGRYAYAVGSYGRALHWMRLAERSAKQSSDPYERAVATYNHALTLNRTHTVAETVAKFDAAISEFQDTAHPRERAYAQLERANFLLRMTSFREALTDYRHAARDLRGTPWFFDCQLGQVICISQIRSVKTAIGVMPALNHLARDPEREAKFHHNFAVFCRQLGLLDCALTHLSAALESGTSDASSTAATLAEACLCRIMAGDHPGAQLALARFESLEGSKDPQDLWTMAALSSVLRGASSPSPLLPATLRDDHEHRMAAALSLLLASGHASSRASGKELVHQAVDHRSG